MRSVKPVRADRAHAGFGGSSQKASAAVRYEQDPMTGVMLPVVPHNPALSYLERWAVRVGAQSTPTNPYAEMEAAAARVAALGGSGRAAAVFAAEVVGGAGTPEALSAEREIARIVGIVGEVMARAGRDEDQ